MAPLESNVSSDLTWMLVRGWNSYLVKRPHDGVRPMSAEPGNLLNLHSPRWSGISHQKPVVLQPGKSGKGVHLSIVGKKSHGSQVKGKGHKQELRPAGNNRRTLQSVSKSTGEYRPDAYKAVLGRTSAILRAQRQAPKQRQHKPRGKGKKTAAAAKTATTDAE